MTRSVRIAIALVIVVGLAIVVGSLGAEGLARRQRAAQPVGYYMLQQGQLVRFAIATDAQLHVAVRVPTDEHGTLPPRYGLAVRLVARDGRVLAERVLDAHTRVSANGDVESAVDGITVTPIADTAWLELSATTTTVVARVTRAIARRASPEHRLLLAGIDARWLDAEQVHALDVHRTEVVPAVGDVPVVSFMPEAPRAHGPPPHTSVEPRPTVDARAPAVYNLIGPGRAVIRIDGSGTFDVAIVAAKARGFPVEANTSTTVEVPAGVASLIVTARGAAAGMPSLALDAVRTLDGGPPAPVAHRTPARWLAAATVLDVPLHGDLPIRVVVRGVGDARGAIDLRLLDGDNQPLATYALEVDATADPFTVVEHASRREPVGRPTTTILLPPRSARTLRVTSPIDAIVATEVRIEDKSDPAPAPPYDLAVPPELRFVDVPAKAPSWFPIAPDRTPLEGRWTLVQTPRIELRAPPTPPRANVALSPRAIGRIVAVREPLLDGAHADQVIVATGTVARLTIAATGSDARLLRMSCDVRDRLGGEVRVRLDGRDATSVPVVVEHVDIAVATSPGLHDVELAGTPVTCVARARSSSRGALAGRHAVPVDPRAGVELAFVPAPLSTTSCALYTTATSSTLEIEIVVDDGAPRRRTGDARRITTGRRVQSVPLADGAMLGQGLAVKRAFVHVPVGDDLAAGRHTIALRPPAHTPLWARCWMPGERHTEQVTTWFTSED